MDDLEVINAKIQNEIIVTNEQIYDVIKKTVSRTCCKARGLEHWDKWLKERKKQYEHLCKATKRSPDMLITNKEIPWELKHEKALLEESQLVCSFDKYRGHPNFWLTTMETPKEGKKISIMCEVYPGTLNFNNNLTSTINFGYYGLPCELNVERGLTGEYRQIYKLNNWYSNPTVQKAKLGVEECLRIMEPFKPDIDKLIVLGKGYKLDNDEQGPFLPEIVITEPSPDQDLNKFSYWNNEIDSQSESKPILQVDDILIDKDSSNLQSYTWDILFFISKKRRNKKTITIANKGSTVVNYRWKKVSPCKVDEVPLNFSVPDKPIFYFDNTDGVILPGNQISIFFLFKPSMTGLFKEAWQFLTVPNISKSPLLFILQGILDENKNGQLNVLKISKYVDRCVAKAIAHKQNFYKANLNELSKSINYNEILTEREKFECKNPLMYYNKEQIEILKIIYSEINDSQWNYSFEDLFNAIVEIKSNRRKYDYMNKFTQAYRCLMRPSLRKYSLSRRYTGVYILLGEFVDQLQETLEGLKLLFKALNKKEKEEMGDKEVIVEEYKISDDNRIFYEEGIEPEMTTNKHVLQLRQEMMLRILKGEEEIESINLDDDIEEKDDRAEEIEHMGEREVNEEKKGNNQPTNKEPSLETIQQNTTTSRKKLEDITEKLKLQHKYGIISSIEGETEERSELNETKFEVEQKAIETINKYINTINFSESTTESTNDLSVITDNNIQVKEEINNLEESETEIEIINEEESEGSNEINDILSLPSSYIENVDTCIINNKEFVNFIDFKKVHSKCKGRNNKKRFIEFALTISRGIFSQAIDRIALFLEAAETFRPD